MLSFYTSLYENKGCTAVDMPNNPGPGPTTLALARQPRPWPDNIMMFIQHLLESGCEGESIHLSSVV